MPSRAIHTLGNECLGVYRRSGGRRHNHNVLSAYGLTTSKRAPACRDSKTEELHAGRVVTHVVAIAPSTTARLDLKCSLQITLLPEEDVGLGSVSAQEFAQTKTMCGEGGV